MSSRLWALRANRCAMSAGCCCVDSVADSDKPANDKYRELDSNQWPRSYEPRALTTAPSRWIVAVETAEACSDKPAWMINTGGTFRSYDLEVMSPARCPCATPVKCCSCLGSLELWPSVSENRQMENAGSWGRTNVLRIMSPARFLCAIPVGYKIRYITASSGPVVLQ